MKTSGIRSERVLRDKGIQPTKARSAVWNYFLISSERHTIGEVANRLQCDGIGQATVYRAVHLLAGAGLLRRIDERAGKTCFAAATSEHSHPLICSSCNGTVEFDACDLSVLERLLSAQTGYTVNGHRLEVFGMCPKCVAVDKSSHLVKESL